MKEFDEMEQKNNRKNTNPDMEDDEEEETPGVEGKFDIHQSSIVNPPPPSPDPLLIVEAFSLVFVKCYKYETSML